MIDRTESIKVALTRNQRRLTKDGNAALIATKVRMSA